MLFGIFFNYICHTLAIQSSLRDIAHAHRPLALMARMITPGSHNDHSRWRAAITPPPTTRKAHINPLRQPHAPHPRNPPATVQTREKTPRSVPKSAAGATPPHLPNRET